MKKTDIYKIRTLVEDIKNLYRDDRDMFTADKLLPKIEEAIELCNKYLYKMKP